MVPPLVDSDFSAEVDNIPSANQIGDENLLIKLRVVAPSGANITITAASPVPLGEPASVQGGWEAYETELINENVELGNLAVTSKDAQENPLGPIAVSLTYHLGAAGGMACFPNFAPTLSQPGTEFIRGDCNEDGAIDIADPVFTLRYLLGLGPGSSCMDAHDADDMDEIDNNDVLHQLNYLFLSGSPIPLPIPKCGCDTTSDSLECSSYSLCP